MARVTDVDHKDTRDCLVFSVAHLESESVTEPNEETAEIESLEWLYALEHDGEETMARLTDAPVRLLLLDSGSGVSACFPDFAPHVKTLTESSVRARSATGQVTKILGKKTEFRRQRDRSRCEHGSVEDLEANRVVKMVRSGRRIVLDEHDSFIEDKNTGKRIPVELTRGDVFEISAYMSSTSHGMPKKPVLICPNEVVEAEDPGHKGLDESMPVPDAVPRGVAVSETPSDKDRESHELTHLTTQPWCSVCVRAKGLTNGISEGQQVNVQRPKEWITCW